MRDHDAEIKNIYKIQNLAKADREELHNICNQIEQKTDTYNAEMDKKLNEKFTKLLDKQNYAEKEINQNIQPLSKELEKVKYELSDIIDQKFENITRNLDTQTSTLKETYDKLCGDIGKMSTELNKSFKDKAHTLKSMCATFFAKIDTQVTDNIRKVDKIQISHDNFEANFINPAKEVDAKVFSMKE